MSPLSRCLEPRVTSVEKECQAAVPGVGGGVRAMDGPLRIMGEGVIGAGIDDHLVVGSTRPGVVLSDLRLPLGDGGISYGQAAVAAHKEGLSPFR